MMAAERLRWKKCEKNAARDGGDVSGRYDVRWFSKENMNSFGQ